jgi:hypothetical protein
VGSQARHAERAKRQASTANTSTMAGSSSQLMDHAVAPEQRGDLGGAVDPAHAVEPSAARRAAAAARRG